MGDQNFIIILFTQIHQKFADNLENDRRYYPINRGIRSYFSFPERSPMKNKISDEISKELIKINEKKETKTNIMHHQKNFLVF